MVKCVWAASAVGVLFTSQEALRQSINALCAQLDMYNLEVWSILREWDTCAASVEELEEVLAAEMGKEKAQYDVKRSVAR